MDATEAIVELFVGEGVDTVFTLSSEEIIELLSEMEDHSAEQFRIIECRHEQLAALMADGYSRRDDIGVCIVGRGPAIAQTGAALKAADNSGSDVLYLVPETRRTATHDGKGFQQESYLRTTAGSVESIRSPDILLPSLADAFRRIRSGEGPIAVQVPIDVLNAEIPDQHVSREYDTGITQGQAAQLHPDEAKIDVAIETYRDADKTKAPIILVGEGAVRADAKEAIEDLAERLNAYLVTSIRARGYFSNHPYYLGFSGGLGTHIANDHLSNAGFVLAVGCSLNDHTTDQGRLLREDVAVVHIDTDPIAINEYTGVDVGIVGDAKITVEMMLEQLVEEGIDQAGDFWTDRVRDRIAESSPIAEPTADGRPGCIDPRDLIRSLDETLPADRLAVVDVGHFLGWVFDGLTIEHPDQQLWTVDFLALGQALPVGIGIATTGTERIPVVFCGDGGFMMSVQAIETAARYDIPLIVVAVNDDALGAEYHMGQERGYSGSVGKIQAPELATVADSLGAEGYTVRSVMDVEDLEEILRADLTGPIVVDCKVDPDVRHRAMGNMEID